MKRTRTTSPAGRTSHVLHVTNWFPNVWSPHDAVFIQRHIASLAPHCRNTVWHIEVRNSGGWRWTRRSPHADRTFLASLPACRWIIVEWLTLALFLWAWYTRDRSERHDLVNIHIAYPLAVRMRLLQRLIGTPIVLTEHWSIYHYSFRSTSPGLARVKRIFAHGVPLICVSHALADDIRRFSGRDDFPVHVVDNVMDTAHFRRLPEVAHEEGRFFSASGWRFPKRPEVLIEAMALLAGTGIDARLRIAGTGPMLDGMKATIARLGMQDRISLLGHLAPEDLADEMRRAQALLHCSDHETYSAICGEALCTGTPVIASRVGGIVEYMTETTGHLVEDNTAEAWKEVLRTHWHATLAADRDAIARYMTGRASMAEVGKRYFAVLRSIIADHHRASGV